MIKAKLVNGLYFKVAQLLVLQLHHPLVILSQMLLVYGMCLGHMSETGMSILSKRSLLGDDKIEKLDFCEYCVYRKQTKVKFSTAIHKTKGTFDYIHSDL